MFKKMSVALVLVVAFGFLVGCSSQTTGNTEKQSEKQTLLAAIKQRGTIKVGTEGTYPPFSFKNEKGELDGFDVDIINEVAKRIGVKAEFVPTEWKAMFTGLDSERFDVIANQVGITDARKQKYDFSVPYTVSGAQIIVNKDTTNINSVADLKGKKVGTTQGSNYDKMATDAGAVIVHYPGANEILADLAAKRIDAALNDRLFVSEYLLKNPDKGLKAAGETFDKSNTGLAFRKGSPELVEAANNALNSMQADGTYLKIAKKWFGEDVSK